MEAKEVSIWDELESAVKADDVESLERGLRDVIVRRRELFADARDVVGSLRAYCDSPMSRQRTARNATAILSRIAEGADEGDPAVLVTGLILGSPEFQRQ